MTDYHEHPVDRLTRGEPLSSSDLHTLYVTARMAGHMDDAQRRAWGKFLDQYTSLEHTRKRIEMDKRRVKTLMAVQLTVLASSMVMFIALAVIS